MRSREIPRRRAFLVSSPNASMIMPARHRMPAGTGSNNCVILILDDTRVNAAAAESQGLSHPASFKLFESRSQLEFRLFDTALRICSIGRWRPSTEDISMSSARYIHRWHVYGRAACCGSGPLRAGTNSCGDCREPSGHESMGYEWPNIPPIFWAAILSAPSRALVWPAWSWTARSAAPAPGSSLRTNTEQRARGASPPRAGHEPRSEQRLATGGGSTRAPALWP
jgi:hypothetical protein